MVDSSIPSHEIVSLLDEKLAKWSSPSSVPKKFKNLKMGNIHMFAQAPHFQLKIWAES